MDDKELLKIFRKHDKIYHLAGSVGVAQIDKNPKGSIYNNVKLATKLIPLFEQARRPVVFSSTSEIYGDGPFTETSNASIGPSQDSRWGYASAKLTTEFMLRSCGCQYTIARFFNVVGPGQLGDHGMVLPRFINAAKNNEDIIVHGDGSQIRSFCHVKDAVDILIKSSEKNGELYNIGNASTPISMKDLAQKVIDISGSKSQIKFVPYKEAFVNSFKDINYRIPDLTKLKQDIPHEYQYDLDGIIKDML